MIAATLRAGALAHYDGLISGPIPCKVIRLYRDDFGSRRADVLITAARPNYPRGRRIRDVAASHCIPRGALVLRRGQFHILPFTIEV